MGSARRYGRRQARPVIRSAYRILDRERRMLSLMSNPTVRGKASDPDSWPVVWRVVAPDCGAYGQDLVMLESDDEAEARRQCTAMRRGGWPVRLERAQQQPLRRNAGPGLAKMKAQRDLAMAVPSGTRH